MIAGLCDLSKSQVLPGVLGLTILIRFFWLGDLHTEQGPAGTELIIKAARLEGVAPLLSQAGGRTHGVHGELAARSLDLMPRTRIEDKNRCQTGSYSPGIQIFLGDFQTRAWKPTNSVRSQAPFYRLMNSGSQRTRDLFRVLWATECLNWELGFMPGEERWF